jgi:serine phosphatase RsbU (regulator of sigma subunit)/anti-sigma regulatory factor (Ser/Thr protein kinase)
MVTTPVHSFSNRVREAADIPTIVAELERAISEAAGPRFAGLWADPVIADAWHGGPELPAFDPEDRAVAHALLHPEAWRLDDVVLDSPVVAAALAAGARVLLPLVSLGVFVGLVVMGPPASGPDYSPSDLDALEKTAAQAAATLRVARLTQQHEASARSWESNAEELRIAQQIQRSLLPDSLPEIAGWQLEAHYQPARVVGGDLYDFVSLPGDLLGLVVGDASDKSVPAALVMATARTLVRSAALRVVLPGQVLARANDDLCAQIPPGMFVTCFIAILDTSNGRLRYANAGHCPPFLATAQGANELKASGWPLGIMPGVSYEEGEVTLASGNSIVCFSDGLTETHGPSGEMFGTDRIAQVVAEAWGGPLLEAVLAAHGQFAGPCWEPDDDLTIVTLARLATNEPEVIGSMDGEAVLARFTMPSTPDTERELAERVMTAAADLPFTDRQRERLRTAVAETAMNAAEHGNHYRPDLSIGVEVNRSGQELLVRISDRGLGGPIPEATEPNLEAKVAGLQSPRGWGLFLIKKMVDRVEVRDSPAGHIVELTVRIDQAALTDPRRPD